MPPEITIFLFLEWLNQEVQSVIWQKLFKYKYCMRAIISWSFYTFIPFFITVLPKNVFHLFTVRLKILYQSISRDKNLVVIKLVIDEMKGRRKARKLKGSRSNLLLLTGWDRLNWSAKMWWFLRPCKTTNFLLYEAG